MPAIGKSVRNTTKSLGKSAAKKVFEESLELIQESRKQILNERNNPSPQAPQGLPGNMAGKGMGSKLPEDYERRVKGEEKRKLEDLDRRIQEIRKQKLVEDLQKRISAGESINLVDYPELGWEQRQVLQAQMQAIKTRKLQIAQEGEDNLSEPGTKRKRGIFRGRGMKSKVEKLKRKSEIRMPPSG